MRKFYIAFLRVIVILVSVVLSQWTLTKEFYDIPYCNHIMDHVCDGSQGLKGLPISYHYEDSSFDAIPVSRSFFTPLVDLLFWIIIFNSVIEFFLNKTLYAKKGIKYILLKNLSFNILYTFMAILLINIIYSFSRFLPYSLFYFPL